MLLNAPGSSKEETAPAGRDFRGSSASVLCCAWKCPNPQLSHACNPWSCCFCYPEGLKFMIVGNSWLHPYVCHGASAPAEHYLILTPTLHSGVLSSGARYINRCQNLALAWDWL